MRKKIVAGNWKMNGSRQSVQRLLGGLQAHISASDRADIIVLPPTIFLDSAQQLLSDTAIRWGAQNLDPHDAGAFTGEISGPMLKEFGCDYVLVGHSERRTLFYETNKIVAEKFIAACNVGLKPILCVGETLEQNEKGQTTAVIVEQLNAVLTLASDVQLTNMVIAYEPVWAIGTGKTATPGQAQAVHALIREHLVQRHVLLAQNIRILYGGSVKSDNAAQLFAMPDIDGGLVGGASLDVEQFAAICREVL